MKVVKTALAMAVLAAALATVGWRESQRRASPASSPSPGTATTPQVVLFVDPSEEGEAGGCGAIIHTVRAAAKRGVVTEEVDAREPGERATHYRLLVAPAVLVLDASGREQRRFEGEAPATVKAISDEMDKLSAPKR